LPGGKFAAGYIIAFFGPHNDWYMSEKIFYNSQVHEDDATAAVATAQPAILRAVVYAIASLFGFLTLETFLFLPLFYGLDSLIRGRIRASVSTIFVFVATPSQFPCLFELRPSLRKTKYVILAASHPLFLLIRPRSNT
jgi:hypothetical protein